MNLEKRTSHSPEAISMLSSEVISDAAPVKNDSIPAGYSLFRRNVRLINGTVDAAYYSTKEGREIDPKAWERVGESVIDGFIWALVVPEFADHETEDDDRTQEIGNMMSYAMSQGLTEDQTIECYKQAFIIADEINGMMSSNDVN